LLTPPSLALGMGMCFADHNRNSLAALAHSSLFAPLFSSLKPPRMASSRTMVSADSLHVDHGILFERAHVPCLMAAQDVVPSKDCLSHVPKSKFRQADCIPLHVYASKLYCDPDGDTGQAHA